MRMLKPSPGECVDRQTILNLKIKACVGDDNVQLNDEAFADEKTVITRTTMKGASKVNVQPFIEENEMLQQYLEKNWFPGTDPMVIGEDFDQGLDELTEVNERLWKLEDEARVLKAVVPRTQKIWMRGCEILFEINELNDQRAAAVQKINTLFGVRGQEKIYA